MKSTITLLAITVLAAAALVGCHQNTPDNSTDAPSTNSSVDNTNDMTGVTTNMPTSTNQISVTH